MKVCILSDTHHGVRSDSPVFNDYISRSYDWFFEYLDNENIKTVVHMGDLFDRRKYLNYVSASVCRKTFLEPLKDRGIETHIIAGNHDVYWKNTNEVNALDEIVTGRYPNIKTYTMSPETITIDGLDILLVPWIDDSKPQHFYDAIKASSAEIVMGHLAVEGFQMDNGNIFHGGDDRKLFDRFDLVFSGHFHHKSSQGNIHYLGALAEQTWSDWNDPRGFTVFDTATREFVFIQNPHKIFHMLSYDDKDKPGILEDVQAADYSEYKNTYVKVLCMNRTNPYVFDMMIDKLYKAGPVDISVVEEFQTFTESEDAEEVNQAEPTPLILDKYIGGLTLTVDNVKLKKYMKEIYNEAISMEHTG
jgi:DNA repair exonuclease SbcCD nuclease subunit